MIDLRKQMADCRAAGMEQLKSLPRKKLADGSEVLDLTQDQHNELRNRGAEMDALGAMLDAEMRSYNAEQIEAQEKADAEARAKKVSRSSWGGEHRNLGAQIVESEEYKNRGANGHFQATGRLTGAELRTLVSSSAGFDPWGQRLPDVVPMVSRPPQIIDYLPYMPITSDLVQWYKQTTRTNNAAETLEGNAAGEAALAWTLVETSVRDIPVVIPVTDNQLADVGQLRSLIENDITLMVRQRLDQQVTVGDGTSPNLLGLYNQTGAQTEALGGNTRLDQILNAMVKIARSDSTTYGGGVANLVVLRSEDWQDLMQVKDAENRYMLGDPANTPGGRVWGLPIVMNDALTSATGMVLDTSWCALGIREDVTVEATNSHGELFAAYITALRARVRAALIVKRDAAIVKLTGI